jgi:hypothetical protein
MAEHPSTIPPVRPISERQFRTRISSTGTCAPAAMALISSRAEGVCFAMAGRNLVAIAHAFDHDKGGFKDENKAL